MDTQHSELPSGSTRILWLVVIALVCASTFSVAYLVRQRRQARELEASRDQLSAAFAQARSQIQELSARLDALSAVRQAAPESAEPAHAAAASGTSVASGRRAAGRRAAVRRPADPRWKQIQSQIAEQQKQIAQTQQDLQKNTGELQNKLSSTHEELTGSIAKTHDELVNLQKRGERNYYEFQLSRSKQFQRVGPISVALRKADMKHEHYDLAMFVDDLRLEKKHVNLYEPVWINLSDRPQPVELVVNKITKNGVAGYLSEPKYKKSELAASAQPPAPSSQGQNPSPSPGLTQR